MYLLCVVAAIGYTASCTKIIDVYVAEYEPLYIGAATISAGFAVVIAGFLAATSRRNQAHARLESAARYAAAIGAIESDGIGSWEKVIDMAAMIKMQTLDQQGIGSALGSAFSAISEFVRLDPQQRSALREMRAYAEDVEMHYFVPKILCAAVVLGWFVALFFRS